MSTTPTFNAQLLGQTEKAANAVLDRLLDLTDQAIRRAQHVLEQCGKHTIPAE